MAHLDPGLFSGRRRRHALLTPAERHASHTQTMLLASALAAMAIVGIAGMLISAVM